MGRSLSSQMRVRLAPQTCRTSSAVRTRPSARRRRIFAIAPPPLRYARLSLCNPASGRARTHGRDLVCAAGLAAPHCASLYRHSASLLVRFRSLRPPILAEAPTTVSLSACASFRRMSARKRSGLTLTEGTNRQLITVAPSSSHRMPQLRPVDHPARRPLCPCLVCRWCGASTRFGLVCWRRRRRSSTLSGPSRASVVCRSVGRKGKE